MPETINSPNKINGFLQNGKKKSNKNKWTNTFLSRIADW